MAEFIKGLDLCRGFFFDAAKPILDRNFPKLQYSAGLIGYGSDVLGYDDEVSRDHMWGPRFYFFLDPADIGRKDEISDAFARELPYEYKGYSVNFSVPDPDDNGVQHPEFITSGRVNPLIFLQTFDEFLEEELGTSDLTSLTAADWLTFSEHRLLSLTSGEWFHDGLNLNGTGRLGPIRFYPEEVRRYRIAANWDIIASEQAFVRRCADVGDDPGSVIVAARIAERLMRLCFLYTKQYAPYSKWFGTAFARLDVPQELKDALHAALHAPSGHEREEHLIHAQALVAALHNESGITPPVDFGIETYYGRNIKVIFADKFAEAVLETLDGTALADIPLLDALSASAGLSNVTDDRQHYPRIRKLYSHF